jgi:hypothetical protein
MLACGTIGGATAFKNMLRREVTADNFVLFK